MLTFPNEQQAEKALLLLLYEHSKGLHQSRVYETLGDLFELSLDQQLRPNSDLSDTIWSEIVRDAAQVLIDAGYVGRRPMALWRLTLPGFVEAARMLSEDHPPNRPSSIGKALH